MKDMLIKKEDTLESSMETANAIESEYLELFLSSNTFTGVTKDMSNYLLKLIWYYGYIVAFPVVEEAMFGIYFPISYDYKGDIKKFRPLLPCVKDMSKFPTVYTLEFEVDKTAVIGYFNNYHIPMRELVEIYLKKLSRWDDSIEVNRNLLGIPWLIAYNKNNKNIPNLIKKARSNNEYITALPLSTEELKETQGLQFKTECIIDRLQAQREKDENKLKTLLGVNNVNFEKKERLVSGEVDANNEEIDSYWQSHLDNMKEFCTKCNTLLGTNLSFNAMEEEEEEEEEDKDKEEEQDNDTEHNNGE